MIQRAAYLITNFYIVVTVNSQNLLNNIGFAIHINPVRRNFKFKLIVTFFSYNNIKPIQNFLNSFNVNAFPNKSVYIL